MKKDAWKRAWERQLQFIPYQSFQSLNEREKGLVIDFLPVEKDTIADVHRMPSGHILACWHVDCPICLYQQNMVELDVKKSG